MRRHLTVQNIVSVGVTLFCVALVFYPLIFLGQASFNTGDPRDRPPKTYGLDNYGEIFNPESSYLKLIWNTLQVTLMGTAMAVPIGLVLAWIVNRTTVPWREGLERMMTLPYYVTPLVGALAWSALASPRAGLINAGLARLLGQSEVTILDANSPFGIAWVMALFEGTVVFVMISAAFKSMDPALEESSEVLGASKFYTVTRVTIPLVLPAILSATFFVVAEMMASFAAAAVLGLPGRFFVITTAIWTLVVRFPPDYPLAATLGISLFAFMIVMMYFYGKVLRGASYVTITGKAFRPRLINMRRWTPVLFGVCVTYVFLGVILPLGALLFVSLLKFPTPVPKDWAWTLQNYYDVIVRADVTRTSITNSLLLGLLTGVIGAVLMGILAWIIYRSTLPGRGWLEYVVMFPQSIPRMVFSLGMLWAWLMFPVAGMYGSIWLLLLAYITVLMPLGVRAYSGVIVQLGKDVEECARVCGASWLHTLRTITLPLIRPGVVATFTLLFISAVREVNASVLLVGTNNKVIGPTIVAQWEGFGMSLTAALALVQSVVVFAALIIVFKVAGKGSQPLD